MGWFTDTYKKFQENMPTSFKDVAVDTLFLAGGLCSGGIYLLGAATLVGYRVQRRIEKNKREEFLKSGKPLPTTLKKWGEKTKKERRATVLNWMVAGVGAYFLGYANGLVALGYTLLGETALRHVAMHEGIAYGKKVNDINSDRNLSGYQKRQILKSMAKKRIIPFLWRINSAEKSKQSSTSFNAVAPVATRRVVVPVTAENIKVAAPHVKAKVMTHNKQNDVEGKKPAPRKLISMAKLDELLNDRSGK